MKTVAVTGPVCGGKSTLSGLLAARGAALVDADRLGHQVLEEPEITAGLVAAFGREILAAGKIDRGVLGARVFADPRELARLEAIVHPPLAARIDDRLEALEKAGTHELAVVEAAVYFLLPIRRRADLVVTVTAPPDVRARRLRDRNGLDEAAVDARIAAQAPLEADWKRADLVIVNDRGPEVLAQAADAVLARLGLGGPRPGGTGNQPESRMP